MAIPVPEMGTWLRCLDHCDCIKPGVVQQVQAGVHGLYVECEEVPCTHYLAPENMDDFEIVTPVFVTEAQKAALAGAVEIAYVDDDAPIYDSPDGHALVTGLRALFAEHPEG